jgi:hypothetical protein
MSVLNILTTDHPTATDHHHHIDSESDLNVSKVYSCNPRPMQTNEKKKKDLTIYVETEYCLIHFGFVHTNSCMNEVKELLKKQFYID